MSSEHETDEPSVKPDEPDEPDGVPVEPVETDGDLSWEGNALGRQALLVAKTVALVLALLAVGFSVFGRRLELVEFQPGGSTFDTAVRPIFMWVFIGGALLALRWQIVGGAIAIFAAAGSVAFAVNLLVQPHALVTVAAFAVPGALWVLMDVFELNRRRAALGLAATAVLAIVGYQLGHLAYDRVWGPTHPESAAPAFDASPTEWIWAGATTSEGATVNAKFDSPFQSVRLVVSPSADLSDPDWFGGDQVVGRPLVSFTVDGLEPDTTYHYVAEVDGELDPFRRGTFTTFPDGPSSFLVAFGGCARVGSNGAVFDAIAELDPLLYTILGDFHYGDNDVEDLQRYNDVLDLTLTRPGQAALYRSTSIAYVWDDHDYGANDSTRDSVARLAAMASYRQYVPSYDLAGPFTAVYQSFTIGRVRFIMTDSRAARDSKNTVDDENKTMLGAEQKAWFKREVIDAAATHELVVWVNPVPWVTEASPGADSWGGFSTERQELADHLVDNGIDNLVMVSGDAHMVAIDDGTNTDFTSSGEGGFPLLHAAALDRPGSVKGGPYSEGAIGGGGQFGTMEIIDDGGAIEVVLTARNWEGETLLTYRFEVPGSG